MTDHEAFARMEMVEEIRSLRDALEATRRELVAADISVARFAHDAELAEQHKETAEADLAAERAAHAETKASHGTDFDNWRAQENDLRAQRDRWKARAEALAKVAAYADHLQSCPRSNPFGYKKDCSCRLDAARREAGL